MIGTRLGPYELLEELGRGGMATVFRAYQPNMDRQVAVKVIHRLLADEAASVERFQREARLVARLEHPHILPVYDFDGTHSPQYIVMRYLAGGTLKQALSRRAETLTFGHVVALLQQVASALDYAHRQGIVHRDLKPSNIMVDSEGNSFLTDFGIARLIGASDTDVTQRGVVVGTPGYMAPEQASGAMDIGAGVDIYALGVVAFEMLTGSLPFEAPTPMAMAVKHIHEPPPRPTELNTLLPPAVDDVLRRSLGKRPEDRHGSAGTLVQELGVALGVLGAHTGGSPPLLVSAPGARSTGLAVPADTQTTRSEQNKLVSVLCVNAAEYAELVDETDGAEAARVAQGSLWERVRAAVASSHGHLLAQSETGLVALWGAEVTREDDAELAVRTGLAVREAFSQIGVRNPTDETLPLRIGVHTGLALITPTTSPAGPGIMYTATGATVSIATRLAERAEGEILIGHDTFRQVRGIFDLAPAEPIRLRTRGGVRAPTLLATYRVVAAKARAFRVHVRGIEGVETAMVGRRAELEQLQKAFLTVTEDRETHLVTLLGGAGLGKSRLLDELDKWADLRPEHCYIFRGRATPATTRSPYALIRDMLAFRFEILDNDPPATVRQKIEHGTARLLRRDEPDEEMAHLLGHLAGFDFGTSPHVAGLAGDPKQLASRARQLFIRFFVRLGAVQPAMITLEDIHNADDASLDLLTDLISQHPDLPLLVVCLARPAFLERRPDWGSGQPNHRRITLEPLDKRDSRELVQEILQRVPEVPRALRDVLVERAEGNPLFMEELVKMLIEDRVILKESEDVWRVETTRLDALRVPPTLAGLLQARLDTLLYPERLTLQRAAVIGRVFHDTALQALDDADEPSVHLGELPALLGRLVERGFLHRREVSSFEGAAEYIFAQNMLRDMIYDSLLRRQRSTYHTAAARWLAGSKRADEYLPVIAEHYERAGNLDSAATYLALAGDRARRTCAFSESRSFYLRALSVPATAPPAPGATAAGPRTSTPAQEPATGTRRELSVHLSLGEVSSLLGAYPEAQAHLDIALGLARAAHDPQATAAALYQLSQVAAAQGDYPRAQALIDESLPLARGAADASTLAQVLYGQGDLLWRSGRYEEAIAPLEESLVQARDGENPAAVLYALNRLGSVSMFQKRVAEAQKRFEEGRELATRTGNRERLGIFLNNLGELERLGESFARARDLYRESLAISREIGRREVESVVLSNLGAVSLKLGELAEAESYARQALALAQEIGFTRMVVGTLIVFAQLRARRGDAEGALELLGLVLAHPAADADLREYAAPTLDELRARHSEETIAAGLARGHELDADTAVDGLLRSARLT